MLENIITWENFGSVTDKAPEQILKNGGLRSVHPGGVLIKTEGSVSASNSYYPLIFDTSDHPTSTDLRPKTFPLPFLFAALPSSPTMAANVAVQTRRNRLALFSVPAS